jgi:C4-dicarboxylate-specific signal transduction histidine kinase
LITMGEMASSVAHELNQPLTAISNYCSGMISRIKAQQVNEQDLLAALDKTARQAQRAGQIILRIRSFVKRSEPNRTLSDVSAMVSESLELAEIEMRRRNVRLTHHVAARLPQLMVDPILIEQVLINLMKNAAESIDNAQRPAGHGAGRVGCRGWRGSARQLCGRGCQRAGAAAGPVPGPRLGRAAAGLLARAAGAARVQRRP